MVGTSLRYPTVWVPSIGTQKYRTFYRMTGSSWTIGLARKLVFGIFCLTNPDYLGMERSIHRVAKPYSSFKYRHDYAYTASDTPRDVVRRLRHLRPTFELRQKFQYNNLVRSVLLTPCSTNNEANLADVYIGLTRRSSLFRHVI